LKKLQKENNNRNFIRKEIKILFFKSALKGGLVFQKTIVEGSFVLKNICQRGLDIEKKFVGGSFISKNSCQGVLVISKKHLSKGPCIFKTS
jgi:hypothetical protein